MVRNFKQFFGRMTLIFGVGGEGEEFATISRDFLSKNFKAGFKGVSFRAVGVFKSHAR